MPIRPPTQCERQNCESIGYKVHPRTLREYVKTTKATFPKERLKGTQWIEVCPACDAYLLGAELTNPCPIFCPDGVIRIVDEILDPRNERLLHFAGLSFTQGAFESACLSTSTQLPSPFDEHKKAADAAATSLIDNPSASNALTFSEKVCLWGGGSRVWGNLQRLNDNDELGSRLNKWLTNALHDTLPDEELIAQGKAIPGLGISFASKHLRILCPDRHAVLDQVISQGFGFASNPAGYRLFLESLRAFKYNHNLNNSLSEIESALFYLVRQKVRTS